MLANLVKRVCGHGSLDTFCNQMPLQRSAFHTTNVLAIKTAGRHKPTIKRDKPLTYEQANKPDMIGVRKSWNSMNSTSLIGGIRRPETLHEDILMRKFIHGTFPRLLASDVIIKRRGNQIVLNFFVLRRTSASSLCFLIGYTEEILSYILKCVVKLELQTIDNETDLTYKYI